MLKMNGNKLVYLILDSVDKNECFENEFDKKNIINFLRLFLEKYEFVDFVENHHITKKEYKKYFQSTMKSYNPFMDKNITKLYKITKGEF